MTWPVRGAPRFASRLSQLQKCAYPWSATLEAPPTTSAHRGNALDLDLLGDLDGVIDLDTRWRTVLSILECPSSWHLPAFHPGVHGRNDDERQE